MFTRITALLCLTALPALAQEEGDQSWGPVDRRDNSYLKSVDDMDVVDADGEKIGEIEEILVDEAGHPAAFHIEVGGFLDIGDEDVAVPLAALTYEDGVYVSKMNRTQIENLPEWDD
ncbi:PRC-barrel domain-containing protein [Pseudoponticoccus marisrubri]|uniref:PRC-barrel domain-containing protein n=1 Tax=Pseudoponticoccus marisrubri TaxID=1685382 RepID=A0A0W7WMR5_9RHOB|nr:PRC-barrel domain-containing protein [Pseudoponticoccus marisrubri]KUF11850.1 hypothetical protein AVJ23_04515 [Pseudoponticoccus marisrubri]